MSDSLELTPQLLDRFAEALRHAGAPLGAQFEPGLTDQQIDELGSQLGVRVPAELRTLWRWGSAPAAALGDNWDINPEFDLWPPSQAVAETREHRLDPTVPKTTIAFGGPSGDGYLLVEGNDDATST